MPTPATVTKTWTALEDATVGQNFAGTPVSFGSGKDVHLTIGYSSHDSLKTRSFLKPLIDWSGIKRHRKSVLYLLVASSGHGAIGGSAYCRARLVDDVWSGGTRGGDEAFYQDNALEWDNMPATNGAQTAAIAVPAAGTWLAIDITALIDTVVPANVLKTNGSAGSGDPLRGIRLMAVDSGGGTREGTGDAAYFAAFASVDGSSGDWYIVVTGDETLPPLAPTNLTPAAGSVHTTTSGTQLTIGGKYMPAGNKAGGEADGGTVQLFANDGVTRLQPDHAFTFGVGGTGDPGETTIDAQGNFTVIIRGLPRQTVVKFRVQNMNRNGQVGPFSALQATTTNAKPSVDARSLYHQPDATSRNTISASLIDPDGTVGSGGGAPPAFISAYEYMVWESGKPQTLLNDPRKVEIGGTQTRVAFESEATYTPNVLYQWRIQLYDNHGAPTGWSPIQSVRIVEGTGPTIMTPGVIAGLPPKVDTTTPATVVGYTGGNIDQGHEQWYADAEGKGNPTWDTGVQPTGSVATWTPTYGDNAGLPVPTGASIPVPLSHGGTYWWRARARRVGDTTIGPWSPLRIVYINALPGAPTVTVV